MMLKIRVPIVQKSEIKAWDPSVNPMNCISNITQGSESPDKKSKSNSQMYLHDNSEVLLDESKKASPSKHTEQVFCLKFFD